MRLRMLIVTVWMLVPGLSWAANCCQVGAGACNIIPPLTHGQNGWTGSVCGTTLTGVNCVAKLDATVNLASGDCLTLGSGVTLDLNGHAINCTSGSCGSAVLNTSSSGGSGAVAIENGDITGPWTTAINVTGGTNSTVSEMVVDGAVTGISGVQGTIDHTVVRNSRDLGIDLVAGKDLSIVVLRDNGLSTNGYGLKINGVPTSSDVDHALFIGNYYHVNYAGTGGTAPSATSSQFQGAVGCDCRQSSSGNCFTATNCFVMPSASSPNTLEDAFVP